MWAPLVVSSELITRLEYIIFNQSIEKMLKLLYGRFLILSALMIFNAINMTFKLFYLLDYGHIHVKWQRPFQERLWYLESYQKNPGICLPYPNNDISWLWKILLSWKLDYDSPMLDPKRGQRNNLTAVWEILRQLEARQCQINIVCQTTTPLLLNDYLSLNKNQAYANICIITIFFQFGY